MFIKQQEELRSLLMPWQKMSRVRPLNYDSLDEHITLVAASP